MHIETPKKIVNGKKYHQVLLRESYREEGKVKKRTIANLTNKPREQVAAIIEALKHKGKEKVSVENLEQGKTIGFSMVALFMMKQLGFAKVFDKSFESKVAQLLIAARVVLQESRLQALYWSAEDHIVNLLEFDRRLDDKNIYSGLDYIYEQKEKIENRLFKAYYRDTPPTTFYYDVTSSYVEGEYEQSDLVAYGYNRDRKKGKQQIVIGLLSDEEGHAVSIDVYPGNTNDVKTFIDQLERLKKRFRLENVTIVGDGGMIKSEDILTIKEYGYDYITSIGKPTIEKLLKEEKLQMSLFDESLNEVIDDVQDVRYILRCNPIRAKEIKENREGRIEALKTFVQTKSNYYNSHPKAKQETLIKHIDEKIKRLKLASFIDYRVEEMSHDNDSAKKPITITVEMDETNYKAIAKLDGCYVIKTSLTNREKNTKEVIHQNYKNLIRVENAFKTLKTEYLEIRPLYLKTDKRIIGHIVLSMLAYNVVLRLKGYITEAGLDFKSVMRQLSTVKTVKNRLNDYLSFEYLPKVDSSLQRLFDLMKLKLPTKL